MNYGGDAADQIVKYSLDGMDHTLRLSGTIAKELAVFLAAVIKDQKKTHGKTKMIRMLKENRPIKFFTVPSDKIKDFCREGKTLGVLYVVIRDRKNPGQYEVMTFADDAAKVNRVMDRIGLDFVKSESGQIVTEVTEERTTPEIAKTEAIETPEGEIRFEISDFDEEFNIGAKTKGQDSIEPEFSEPENFTQAQETRGESLSDSFLRNSSISDRDSANPENRPSVREELKQIKEAKEKSIKKKQRNKSKNRSAGKRKRRVKGKGR